MELCYANNPRSLFRKYAKLVTWFANTKIGKTYLSIRSFPLPSDPIHLLLPNGYIQHLGKDKYRLSVTTSAVYAPRLYPILSYIDSFGVNFNEAVKLLLTIGEKKQASYKLVRLYSSATINPDANPETTTFDGVLSDGNATWATIRGASSASFEVNDSGNTIKAETYLFGGTTYYIGRLFTLFDTSSLTSSAVVESATYSLYKNATAVSNGNTTSFALVTTTPASNTAIASGDFDQVGSVRQASDFAYASMSTSAYFDMTLNATGLGNISLTGITKFGGRNSRDIDDSAPTGTNSIECNSSDVGSNKPKLVITYWLPSTQYLKGRRRQRIDLSGVSAG